MNSRNRKSFNIIIDTVAYAGFVFLATTGLLMRYTLPAGSGHHTTVWGLDRHEWGALHFWIAIAFLAILVFHLILHWNWIVCVLRGRKTESSGLRFGLGLFGLIALLFIAFTPLLSPVESVFHPGQQRRLQQDETIPAERSPESTTIEEEQDGSQQPSGREEPASQKQSMTEQSSNEHEPDNEFSFDEIAVRGNMTLSEVSTYYKVPVSHILKELGLPENTDENETFGRLRKIYDFEVHDVRRIILDYQEKQD
jgi:hypothetical protein